MAVVIGNEYDHITISDGTDQTVHYLKDSAARTLLDNKADKNNTVITGSLSLGRKANTTVGSNSFAVGNNVEASGTNSHAEGNLASAQGVASHAEGMNTSAVGNYSHAEGLASAAEGVASHSEGEAIAYAEYSHAEGAGRTNGGHSHAEGGATQANGEYSHAEGLYTVAAKDAQHVFGRHNIADNSSGIYGTYVEIVGNGSSASNKSNARTLDWSGNERLAGSLTLGAGTANETSITASELATIKSGGSGTTDYDDLTNKPQIAGTTLTGNKTLDDIGIAAKNNAVFTGTLSKGRKANTTSGTNSVALGEDVEASGMDSHAVGKNTVAAGNYSHAEGNGSQVSIAGVSGHAEGIMTQASAEAAHAEGNLASAQGGASHAEGMNTSAVGNYSHAEGLASAAEGVASHSEGEAIAYGEYSHAEGAGRTNGGHSHAEGGATQANGDYSHAEGLYTVATKDAQHVFGRHNISDNSSGIYGTYVEIVGNGTSASNKANARTLDWSGNESLAGGLTLGKGTVDETTITAAQLKALLALLS